MRSSQLTPDEYQPITETGATGGSPSHMDIPIHRTTLLSGELHARLDPVAYPQAGTRYAGTVSGVTFPAPGVALLDEAVDRSGDTYTPTLAGAVRPRWSSEPRRTSDTFGIEDGWGVTIGGRKSYKVVVEIANGTNAPTQFPFVTINAPVVGEATGLTSIGGGKAVNAIYVVRSADQATRANALLIKSFADAYVPPAGPHWSVTPALSGDKAVVVAGTAVLTAAGPVHWGITWTAPGDPTLRYFAYSTFTLNPGDVPFSSDQAGIPNVTGQGGTITELWVGPTSSRADAILAYTF